MSFQRYYSYGLQNIPLKKTEVWGKYLWCWRFFCALTGNFTFMEDNAQILHKILNLSAPFLVATFTKNVSNFYGDFSFFSLRHDEQFRRSALKYIKLFRYSVVLGQRLQERKERLYVQKTSDLRSEFFSWSPPPLHIPNFLRYILRFSELMALSGSKYCTKESLY